MICYQPKLQTASSEADRASATFAFAFAVATFVSTLIFLTAANASAALVSFFLWGVEWCVCACGSCCRRRTCSSARDGACVGLGFGVWRRLFEQL